MKLLRFFTATLACVVATALTALVLLPAYFAIIGAPLGTLHETLLAMVVIAPIVLMFAVVIALPLTLAFGGLLHVIERRRRRDLGLSSWLATGLAVGLIASYFFGKNDPMVSARLAAALLFAVSGAAGSVAFWWLRVPSAHPRQPTI